MKDRARYLTKTELNEYNDHINELKCLYESGKKRIALGESFRYGTHLNGEALKQIRGDLQAFKNALKNHRDAEDGKVLTYGEDYERLNEAIRKAMNHHTANQVASVLGVHYSFVEMILRRAKLGDTQRRKANRVANQADKLEVLWN
jgi:FAD synthase